MLVLVVTVAAPLGAQSSKSFFAGKTITMFAGSSPGGGTDQTVRLIARHLERYIPGKPTILVVNKPGAGGLIAVNELYIESRINNGYPFNNRLCYGACGLMEPLNS